MRKKEKQVTFFLFSLPAVLCYGIFFILPLILGLYYSFTDWNGIAKGFQFIGMENYMKILRDRKSYSSILFTVKYAAMGTINSSTITEQTSITAVFNIYRK